MLGYKALYPTQDHDIIVKGRYVGYPLSEISHTFNLKLTDPCASTILTIDAGLDRTMFIGAASPISHQSQVTDTVSDNYGKLGFCGPKTFTEEGTSFAWFTVNASTGFYDL